MSRFLHPTLSAYRTRTALAGRPEGGRRAPRASDPSRPLVTIVTAVFNGEEFLRESIESVLAQSYPNVELVVADGGSKDRTLEILASYGDRIDAWFSERDTGMFDGMNRGIAAASGELIKIHGCDDLLPRDSAERAVETYLEHRARAATTVVRSDMELVDEHGKVIACADASTQFRYMPAILHPTWYVPVALYERFGLYDPRMVVSSDYEMYFYLRDRGVTFAHADAVLCQFRTGGTSSTFAGSVDGFWINREYQGLAVASYLATVTTTRVVGRRVVERSIGRERFMSARKQLRALFS